MAYSYKKLADVEQVTNATDPNLLIETDGEIKKIPVSKLATTQVRADWEEEDANSKAFILNKPDMSEAGGANVITYKIDSGALVNMDDGTVASAETIVNNWNNGAILRLGAPYDKIRGSIVALNYTQASGSITSVSIVYVNGSGTTLETLTI